MDADGKEALPFESCFEEKEHELMMQCCERQRYSRLKLSEVKAKLSEMHENAGTCTYCFYYVLCSRSTCTACILYVIICTVYKIRCYITVESEKTDNNS